MSGDFLRVSRRRSAVFDQIRRVRFRGLLAARETSLHILSHGSGHSALPAHPPKSIARRALHITSLHPEFVGVRDDKAPREIRRE